MDARTLPAPPQSLLEVFASIPDPRGPRGKRHPLPALLGLTTVALLAGLRSLEAIAQFGRDHGRALADALGFTHPCLPCKATLSNVFRRLDVAAYERLLSAWLQARCPRRGAQLALDGKTLRGSRSGEAPGVHLLAAYAPAVAGVLAQIRVDGKTNEHKAALELLGLLPLSGTVVTGDALFCQKDFCEAVVEGGGDYLVTVKDNQPTLHFEIAALFAESANFSPLPGEAVAAGAGPLHHQRQGPRPARAADADGHADPGAVSGRLAGSPPSVSDPPPPRHRRRGARGDRLRPDQLVGGRSRRGAVAGTQSHSLGDREPVARDAGYALR